MTRRTHHRGFSLIEAVACMVALSIAVPACMFPLRDAATARVDALQTERAAMLFGAVTETILADVASADPDLGFDALANANAYLNSAGDGLYDRLEAVADLYAEHGLRYSVAIGPLVSASGVATGDAGQDAYRWASVTVRWRNTKGARVALVSGVLVGAP